MSSQNKQKQPQSAKQQDEQKGKTEPPVSVDLNEPSRTTRKRRRRNQKTSWGELVFVAVFTLVLVLVDSYLNSERRAADLLIHLRSNDLTNSSVVIVQIGEQDFVTEFRNESPLAPAIVLEVIDGITLGSPRAIGVDILTSDENGRSYLVKEGAIPIVWAAGVKKLNDIVLTEYLPPLAGQELPRNHYAALPETPAEEGIHRTYEREIEVVGVKYPTFPWELYKRSFATNGKDPDAGPLYITFRGQDQQDLRPTVSAAQVLGAARNNNIDELRMLFENKIVIIGGMFEAARDRKVIPQGLLGSGDIFGVQLMATVVETEIEGEPNRPLNGGVKFLINVLMIFIFTMNFVRNGVGAKSSIIALSTITFAAILVSLVQQKSLSAVPFIVSSMLIAAFIALFDVVIDRYKASFKRLLDEATKGLKGRLRKT